MIAKGGEELSKRKYDRNGNQYYYRNSVLGASDSEKLAGLVEEGFNVKVNAYIEGRDFCNAVRRCLINDLVAGAMDENGKNKDK